MKQFLAIVLGIIVGAGIYQGVFFYGRSTVNLHILTESDDWQIFDCNTFNQKGSENLQFIIGAEVLDKTVYVKCY